LLNSAVFIVFLHVRGYYRNALHKLLTYFLIDYKRTVQNELINQSYFFEINNIKKLASTSPNFSGSQFSLAIVNNITQLTPQTQHINRDLFGFLA